MLTRIISGAVAVVILAVVLFFHNTIVLPIAVSIIIAIMLFELLRAVKLHKCIPILCAVELYGICLPFNTIANIPPKLLKSGLPYTRSGLWIPQSRLRPPSPHNTWSFRRAPHKGPARNRLPSPLLPLRQAWN